MGSAVKLVLSGVLFSALDQGRALKPRTLRVQSRAHSVPAQSPRSQLGEKLDTYFLNCGIDGTGKI